MAGTAVAIVSIALGAALGGSDPEPTEVAGVTTVLDEAVSTTAGLVDRALELDQGDDSEPSTTTQATYTGQDCVAAVLHELEVIRSEIENPWTEEWSTNTDENPLLRADDEAFVTCTNSGPTPEGFSEVWTRVRDDYRTLRLHIKFGEPRPSIEDVTPLADVEAFVTE